MTDRTFVSGSIAELLASVAGGVRDAQEALSAVAPVDAFGRPQPTYHMPYVDFEFRVDFETRSLDGGGPLLFARPRTETNAEIASVISGRLVAIPPGEGRPLPVLQLTATRLSARQHRITVLAANTAGELLAGATVELNLDMDASRRLSEAVGAPITSLKNTNVEAAVLVTDAGGKAETLLAIDSTLPAKAVLMVKAELGAGTASLTLPAGNT